MANAWSFTMTSCLAGAMAAGGMMLRLQAQQSEVKPPEPPALHQSLVNRYCVSCHNDRLKRGGLALDAIVTDEVAGHPDVWEKVIRKIRARQMPPIGLPRPDEATYDAAVA